MNKGIEVTRENFNDIASRLVRFFNHDSFVSWHGFDCGMKKRISRIFRTSSGELVDVTREYPRPILTERWYNEGEFPVLHIVVSSFGEFTVEEGDVVWFLGNRIIIKNNFSFSSHHSMYTCFQIGKLKDFNDFEGIVRARDSDIE